MLCMVIYDFNHITGDNMYNEDFQDQRDTYFTPLNKTTQDKYEEDCHENGEVPCIDNKHHKWVVSDENENICYCERCGTPEY